MHRHITDVGTTLVIITSTLPPPPPHPLFRRTPRLRASVSPHYRFPQPPVFYVVPAAIPRPDEVSPGRPGVLGLTLDWSLPMRAVSRAATAPPSFISQPEARYSGTPGLPTRRVRWEIQQINVDATLVPLSSVRPHPPLYSSPTHSCRPLSAVTFVLPVLWKTFPNRCMPSFLFPRATPTPAPSCSTRTSTPRPIHIQYKMYTMLDLYHPFPRFQDVSLTAMGYASGTAPSDRPHLPLAAPLDLNFPPCIPPVPSVLTFGTGSRVCTMNALPDYWFTRAARLSGRPRQPAVFAEMGELPLPSPRLFPAHLMCSLTPSSRPPSYSADARSSSIILLTTYSLGALYITVRSLITELRLIYQHGARSLCPMRVLSAFVCLFVGPRVVICVEAPSIHSSAPTCAHSFLAIDTQCAQGSNAPSSACPALPGFAAYFAVCVCQGFLQAFSDSSARWIPGYLTGSGVRFASRRDQAAYVRLPLPSASQASNLLTPPRLPYPPGSLVSGR
ncbi:hypothetical protein HYPSUDRAFT_204701 [Hypholoma sublateritium FD-334 SS-4]|uniref:Uncharacterized protein n=1 Tax=Hypholoma sublateritium (strain FD-334 SS-4) TaxID=945553 RepID=A0A0D2NRH6_HYPSF|nr:hypothetical protein HYPSUDRAFT_204701 [Hypholoma sublateritium FD-334 SS-4]